MRQQFFETRVTEPAALKQQLEREYAFWDGVVEEADIAPRLDVVRAPLAKFRKQK